MAEKIVNVQSTRSDILQGEVWQLFIRANNARFSSGTVNDLRNSAVRSIIDDGVELPESLDNIEEPIAPSCGCDDEGSCDLCSKALDSVCVTDAMVNYRDYSPFSGIANLLATTKKYEYIALAENAYAEIGNKPFKFKARKGAILPEKDLNESASSFYAFLENFLTENNVTVNDIPDAFDFDTLNEVADELTMVVKKGAEDRLQSSLSKNEEVMERIFKRSNFMSEYLEVIRDTTDWPIGVMWVDDTSIKKEKNIVNGVMKSTQTIQSDATRIDPRYFWATDDFEINKTGRAVFTLRKMSKGDLRRVIKLDTSGSAKLNDNIEEYLEDAENGYTLQSASLFSDDHLLNKGEYDVLISRGEYDREGIEELEVTIPDEYVDEDYIPCEVWYSGGKVLRVKIIECADETLGVYTTVFRRRGASIFGHSLHAFIHPFAKLYEGTVKGIDKSVGKSVGSIVMIDTGVIEDPEKYMNKDPTTGEITLDLSEDLLIEFDSSNAFNSPNFKGVPIFIEQIPSDLTKLLPVLSMIFSQLEILTGIPNILVSAQNISSALRTTDNFNAAFNASSKTIKSLLRESENRVLKPSIKYFFVTKALSGEMKDFLIEADPEILLSDTLTREANDDRKLVNDVRELSQFVGIIPPENLSALVNNLGKEVYGLENDIIPGIDPLSTQEPSQAVNPV